MRQISKLYFSHPLNNLIKKSRLEGLDNIFAETAKPHFSNARASTVL